LTLRDRSNNKGQPRVLTQSAVFTLTIAVGVQDRPAAAPQFGSFTPDVKIVADPTFAELMSAVAMIVFAFSGTPAFFPIAAEMRNPRHYTRSMLICQATVTTVYLVIGVVVYSFCGSYVASPALGSAGPLMKKVCYGVALPGLLVTMMIVSHVSPHQPFVQRGEQYSHPSQFPAKMLLVRFLSGSKHLTANTFTHWATWLSCTCGVVLLAYIIASAVPKFDSLIALIGALLGPPICLIPFGWMWLYDNWRAERNLRWWLMATWSVFVIVVGVFLMVAGTYGAVVGLVKDYEGVGGKASWSCEDNSNSS
jgi:amino acid permease